MKRLVFVFAILGMASWSASAALLFSDDFNYSDGSLSGPSSVSGGIWYTHSATATQTGQVDVASSRVNLTGNEAEDVSAQLAGAPISSGTIYYSMIVNFSVLPAGVGNYFANLRDSGTGFRARLDATTTGAAAGTLQLGINNGSTPPTGVSQFPLNLSLGSDYLAVVRYDIGSSTSTLWVSDGSSPLLESGPSVSATDTSVLTIAGGYSSISLRQSRTSGPVDMGTLTVDNVRVATTFAEVLPVPEPSTILLGTIGGLLGFLKLRRKH
jgi:hypothetical protein